ncbi:RNA polymerase sigma-70 factor [Sunxiuqinia indica]|uniref:RNA polymerase sigma-70 factor n=1 Tax=Sunxiuqinia indica TaxID=2692584 RepID=UPI001F30C457|nr:RNA polymerase sigma-70 factor [Sunxiuqinia indica]
MKYDDKNRLLIGLKSKDLDAYEMIFFRYHGRLVLFANKFTYDLEVAQDIVQDAFLTLWEKADLLTINDSPKSYLFQMVKNRSLNYKRHLNVKSSVKDRLIAEIQSLEIDMYNRPGDPFESLLESELENRIDQIIQKLPGKCQRVFVMSRKEHRKNKEIAEELGVSVKTVEKYISKALKVLRIELADYIGVFMYLLFKNL